jgi:hypothetical protein
MKKLITIFAALYTVVLFAGCGTTELYFKDKDASGGYKLMPGAGHEPIAIGNIEKPETVNRSSELPAELGDWVVLRADDKIVIIYNDKAKPKKIVIYKVSREDEKPKPSESESQSDETASTDKKALPAPDATENSESEPGKNALSDPGDATENSTPEPGKTASSDPRQNGNAEREQDAAQSNTTTQSGGGSPSPSDTGNPPAPKSEPSAQSEETKTKNWNLTRIATHDVNCLVPYEKNKIYYNDSKDKKIYSMDLIDKEKTTEEEQYAEKDAIQFFRILDERSIGFIKKKFNEKKSAFTNSLLNSITTNAGGRQIDEDEKELRRLSEISTILSSGARGSGRSTGKGNVSSIDAINKTIEGLQKEITTYCNGWEVADIDAKEPPAWIAVFGKDGASKTTGENPEASKQYNDNPLLNYYRYLTSEDDNPFLKNMQDSRPPDEKYTSLKQILDAKGEEILGKLRGKIREDFQNMRGELLKKSNDIKKMIETYIQNGNGNSPAIFTAHNKYGMAVLKDGKIIFFAPQELDEEKKDEEYSKLFE